MTDTNKIRRRLAEIAAMPQTLETWGEHSAYTLALCDEVDKLQEAAIDSLASLVAAHSLLKSGGKKAAASDKIFEIMLSDYARTIERTRATLGEKS